MKPKLGKLILTLLTVALFTPVFAQQQTVSIICRCVEGGVNAQMVEWLKQHVFPAFEEKMRAEGREVRAHLTEFGGSDEALRQQYALDLSVGAGADVLAFDGFWVPEFVEAGYLQSLEAVAGGGVWDWDG